MLALIRRLLPVLAAAMIGACAASSGGERASLPPTPLTQPAALQSKEVAPQPSAPGEQDAVRKAALSLASFSDPTSKTYKIGPRDVLDVTVFKAPELSRTVQVSEAGTINFPLIGEVDAGGKTAREIEQEIAKKLGTKYLQDPQVSVFVKDYFSQRITMEGAIKKPGVYPIAGGMSLLQAIAQAGGFEDTASSEVALFRQANGRRLAGRYSVSDIRDGSAEDPQLEAGDVIVVSTSDLKWGFNTALRMLPLAQLAPLL